jgi:predicted CopG family antitoxin
MGIAFQNKKIICVYAYTDTHMGTKTISIMDDVYELLVKNRRDNESFSDVIRRALSKKKDIMKFAGIWKDMPPERIEAMKKAIEMSRTSKRDYL